MCDKWISSSSAEREEEAFEVQGGPMADRSKQTVPITALCICCRGKLTKGLLLGYGTESMTNWFLKETTVCVVFKNSRSTVTEMTVWYAAAATIRTCATTTIGFFLGRSHHHHRRQ